MFLSLALTALVAAQPATRPFKIEDGDRIVWIGNTLVEREQRYGYWEAALHAAHPDKHFTLRNLGWSGDTVFGDARAGFETPAKGFKDLIKLTLDLKPTVIFVSYGTNEAFEGAEGLPKFEKGLERLLDSLAPTKARIVLFTPLRFQAPADKRNEMLARYRTAIQSLGDKRPLYVADLFDAIGTLPPEATENGMHLTDAGYKATSGKFLQSMGHEFLGRRPEDTESLRQAIVAKNELFFHRWRPQNETYLFGFRKHEQGNNAVEVAKFEPLVAEADKVIAKLRKALKD